MENSILQPLAPLTASLDSPVILVCVTALCVPASNLVYPPYPRISAGFPLS